MPQNAPDAAKIFDQGKTEGIRNLIQAVENADPESHFNNPDSTINVFSNNQSVVAPVRQVEEEG